ASKRQQALGHRQFLLPQAATSWRTLRQITRDFGDKRQRRAGRSVAASFRALCHDGVGSGIERLVHMPQGLHLADQLGLGVMNLGRAKGCGSPKERNTQYGERFNTSSSACGARPSARSEEHTSELQSRGHLVCRLLLEKKKQKKKKKIHNNTQVQSIY